MLGAGRGFGNIDQSSARVISSPSNYNLPGSSSSWLETGIQRDNQLQEIALMNYKNMLNQSNARDANLMEQQNATLAHERTKELLELQQAYNSEEAQKVRDWNAESYQRTMRDMRAAGLNPILAYSQGAAVTGGQAATSGFTSASKASTYMASPAVDTDMDYHTNTALSVALVDNLTKIATSSINAMGNIEAAGTTRHSKIDSTSFSQSRNTNYNFNKRVK